MDFTTIFGAIGSAVSGGVLGLLGTGVKMWAEHKAEQAKQAFEIKMREMDQAEMTLEHQLKIGEIEAAVRGQVAVAEQGRLATEAQASADIEKGELKLRADSYLMDKATYGGGIVDAVRGLMRPVLTVYFAVLMAIIAWELIQINNGIWVNQELAQTMLRDIINACIFLATTAVTWWFGSRPIKRG